MKKAGTLCCIKSHGIKMRLAAFFCAIVFVMPVFSFSSQAKEGEFDLPVAISAPAAVVMDVTTGDVLYIKDGDTPYQPAGLVKVLAVLVTLEHCPDLQATITFSSHAVWGFDRTKSIHLYFDVGEQITLQDVVHAVMLKSANEAAMAMAEFTVDTAEPGNSYQNEEKTERFVAMMNAKAQSIGANHSKFTNPHGLQDDAQYTTAHDMALIMAYALKNQTFAAITKTRSYSIPPTNKRGQTCHFNNGHNWIQKGTGTKEYKAIGGHQGRETAQSGFNLITYAQNSDGANVVSVVMKASSEPKVYEDTKALMAYYLTVCTRLYMDVSVLFAGKHQITVFDGKESVVRTASVEYEPIAHIMPKEATLKKLTYTVTQEDNLVLPLEEGTKIGIITWYYKGKRVADTHLYTAAHMTVAEAENTAPPLDETAKKVEQRNVFSVLWGILKWVLLIVFILAALAAVSVLIYIIAMRRKARKKRDAAFWERRNVNK